NGFLPNDLIENLGAKFAGDDLVFHSGAAEYWSGPGVTVAHQMTRCRCFLPDLAGFTGSNCTAPLSLITERVGFEPTVEFPPHTLSKRAPSTTRTSLQTAEPTDSTTNKHHFVRAIRTRRICMDSRISRIC